MLKIIYNLVSTSKYDGVCTGICDKITEILIKINEYLKIVNDDYNESGVVKCK